MNVGLSTLSAHQPIAATKPSLLGPSGLPGCITIAEAQELLGIPIGNRARLSRMVRQGKIQLAPELPGHRPRIELAEVERVLGRRVTLMQFAQAQASLRARRDQYRAKRPRGVQ